MIRLGVNYSNSKFEYQANEQNLPNFSQEKELYKSIKKNSYFEHLIDFGSIALTNRLAYGDLSYLNSNKRFFNYKDSLSYYRN